MLNHIRPLEITARTLEPEPQQRAAIATQAHSVGGSVYRYISAPQSLAYKHTGRERHILLIEEHGKPFADILDNLRTEVDFDAINSASGGHLGYIPGGGIWTSAVPDLLAAAIQTARWARTTPAPAPCASKIR